LLINYLYVLVLGSSFGFQHILQERVYLPGQSIPSDLELWK
jgi:hypothetical protein